MSDRDRAARLAKIAKATGYTVPVDEGSPGRMGVPIKTAYTPIGLVSDHEGDAPDTLYRARIDHHLARIRDATGIT